MITQFELLESRKLLSIIAEEFSPEIVFQTAFTASKDFWSIVEMACNCYQEYCEQDVKLTFENFDVNATHCIISVMDEKNYLGGLNTYDEEDNMRAVQWSMINSRCSVKNQIELESNLSEGIKNQEAFEKIVDEPEKKTSKMDKLLSWGSKSLKWGSIGLEWGYKKMKASAQKIDQALARKH